jgi:alpha-1,6-mannosyltransferase
LYRLNPIIVAPSAVSSDPLFPYLHYWWNTNTAYGPLWFLVTLPAYLVAGDGLISNIVAYKALPFAFELIALLFIVLIVRRIDPPRVAAAVVCFGWNPLVLWEIAGNGHNDIVMMSFALAALFLLLTARWPLAFPLLACSILVKFVSAILLPAFILWILLRNGRRAIFPLTLGMLAAALISILIVFPFWAGKETITPLRAQQNYFIYSPASALIGSWGEDLSNTPKVTAVKHGLTIAFFVLYGLVLTRLRRNPVSLIQVSVAAMFLLLVLMTWWFWPWYVIWGLALAALLPSSSYARLFVLFSMTAMLLYVSSPWKLQLWNFASAMPMPLGNLLIVFLPPVLYATMQIIGTSGGHIASPKRSDNLQ